MSVEEDGDEIFVPIKDVQCCRIGFDGDKPVYSKIVKVRREKWTWWCCDKCGASYGEAK